MALTTKRIIALPSQNDPQEGDYLAIDNATSGTHKIPVGRIGVEVDDTLTEQGKAADAKAVGDALDEIRSQIEVTGTASGAIATFTDGSDAPMKSCIVSIEPQQSGTGTPSPDNVRQISGWESVDLWGGTANALDLSWWSGRTYNGITFTLQPNGKVRMHGTTMGASWTFIDHEVNLPYNGIGAGDEILLYSDSQIFIRFYDSNNTLIGDVVANNTSNVTAIPTTATKMRVFIYAFGGVPTAGTTYDVERSFYLSRNTTFTEWQPYTGTTHTTALGRTVYGGTLDVVSGVLTVDKVFAQLDSETVYNTAGSARVGGHWAVSITNVPNVSKAIKGNSSVISSVSPPDMIYSSEAVTGFCKSLADYPIIILMDEDSGLDGSATAQQINSAVNSWVHEHTPQIVYELATPTTYTLTPTEVNTLLGENNVWADSGDISVTYVRDLNIAINNLIGE